MELWKRRGRDVSLAALAATLMIGGPGLTPLPAQVAPPPGWRWGTDHPVRMTSEWNLPDSTWRFVQMAPGWHITTRPGALMYDPSVQASGNYVLESVQILFPGTTQSGYGLFFGGRELDGAGGAGGAYFTFLLRRDGHITVEAHRQSTTTILVPWTAAPSIQQVTGDMTARNVLTVVSRPDSVVFEVNAVAVAALGRGDLAPDGFFGFRTGADLNLHVTTLDYTRRLAPVPRK